MMNQPTRAGTPPSAANLLKISLGGVPLLMSDLTISTAPAPRFSLLLNYYAELLCTILHVF